jgi:hypothetical protein
VDWGNVTLTGTNSSTGEIVTVAARSVGDGEWIASISFPTDGSWQLAVAHSDLATSAVPALSVGPPASMTWLPAAIAGVALAGLAGAAAVARAARRGAVPTLRGVASRAEG